MKSKIAIIVISMLLQACTTMKYDRGNSLEISIEMTYGFYSYDSMRLENHNPEGGLMLIFPTVPGAIFGNATGDVLHVARITHDYTFNLSLPSHLDNIAKTPNIAGFNVVPANTKLLRLGTFHTLPSHRNEIGGGGFINTQTGESLILVYFSNPAKVRGTVISGSEQFTHNITISKPGWSWIKATKLSANNYLLTEFDGSVGDIDFMVFVEAGLSI
jgi:hypothetical protein